MLKKDSLSKIINLESRILTIRGQKVIIDADLAELYGTTTKRLNEQVRRNSERFPSDFMLQLSVEEWRNFKSKIATLCAEVADEESDARNRSQIATGSRKHRNPRFPPYAFTEFGALMAANVLNSQEAVKMSLYVIRAFVEAREVLTANTAIIKRLAQIDDKLFLHDQALRDLYQKLRPLLVPPPEPARPRIGFKQDPA